MLAIAVGIKHVIAVITASLLFSFVEAAPADASCRAPGGAAGKTVARTPEVRVFSLFPNVYACNYRTNRRFQLDTEVAFKDLVSAAGRFVSYLESSGSSSGTIEILRTLNTRTGRAQHLSVQRNDVGSGDIPVAGNRNEFVRDVAQSPSGSVAWIVEVTTCVGCRQTGPGPCATQVTRQVRALSRKRLSRYSVLDASPLIRERSLVLRGTRLSWRKAGRRVGRTFR